MLIRTRPPPSTHIGEIIGFITNRISSRGVEDLCEAMAKSGSVAHLNLSQNGFGLAGSRALARALRVCQRLVSVNLSQTSLGDDGISALSTGLLGHGTLSELNLR